MNSNFSGEDENTAAPDTEPHHPSRADYVWLVAPIGAALVVAVVGGRAMRLLLPNWFGVIIVSVLALGVWVGGTIAVAIWKARQEQERNRASGGES